MDTIIDNLFNLDILNKTNIINSSDNSKSSDIKNDNDTNKRIKNSIAYTKHKYSKETPNPALEQGYKFKQYQSKITTTVDNKNNSFMKINKNSNQYSNKYNNNYKEGYTNNDSVAQQSEALLNTIKTSTSPAQKENLAKLQQEYDETLKQYTDLTNKISQSFTEYSDRTSTSNPYLNKFIRFTTGQICYVTNQGVAKYIPTTDVLNSISGVNGCPNASSSSYVDVNMSWSSNYNIPGTQLPTSPPLIMGTNMGMNESCGNEGSNVFVNTLLSNPSASYVGCFQDNATTPAMTFIGGAPNASGNANGTYSYSQCQETAILDGYQYFALQNVDTTSGLGYCAVSNSETSSTQYGNAYVPTGETTIWSSSTSGQTGNSAILSVTGALSVINSSGTSVYSTPNSTAQPSNYLGCYGDNTPRAMSMYNGGSQSYDLQQCQQIAQQNGSTYFALQNSTSGTNAQCALSSDWSQTSEYGPAGNCSQISGGSWSGGGWSNAVYNASLPQSNYVLTLLDSGNMTITRGTSPSDDQGLIWETNTSGQQQDANSAYAAANGKYGQNWITSGSTMAAGDFVGSPSGYIALIMQSDGNLVLYTFTNKPNCQQISNKQFGGGVQANALYNIGSVGVNANMGQVAYVDPDSQLYPYPSSNTTYGTTYSTVLQNFNIDGNSIQGASFSNCTDVSDCMKACNNNDSCNSFVYDTSTPTPSCFPKNISNTYSSSTFTPSTNTTTYIRDKNVLKVPPGVSSSVNNINSVQYENYPTGTGNMQSSYGFSNIDQSQKQQLKILQEKLNKLSLQINNIANKFSNINNSVNKQIKKDTLSLTRYIDETDITNAKIHKIEGFNNLDNILNDTKINTSQKQYTYIGLSILAATLVFIAIKIKN